MNMPFYVAPEQMMKDRADYARKGIARGRSLVALRYADGIVICAENPSRTLRKVSEIYDRIAFAGVGKYNEFDQLRIAGVRYADLKGYSFSREDVDARSLANQYAQSLGQIFTHEMKLWRSRFSWLRSATPPTGPATSSSTFCTTAPSSTRTYPWCWVARPRRLGAARTFEQPPTLANGRQLAALAGPERTLTADALEVAVLERVTIAERSDGSTTPRSPNCSPDAQPGWRSHPIGRRHRPTADADRAQG